jgi:hypothetical protein
VTRECENDGNCRKLTTQLTTRDRLDTHQAVAAVTPPDPTYAPYVAVLHLTCSGSTRVRACKSYRLRELDALLSPATESTATVA